MPAPDRKALARRRELAEELLGIHRKHKTTFAREDEIKASLKQLATETENFHELFESKGKVKVAGKRDKQLLGEKPEVVSEKFLALGAVERKALLKSGVIAMVPNYSGAYYGAVTVDVY